MIVIDKRKKCTIPVQDVGVGMIFEDMSGDLFMKVDLDGSCYPSGLHYDTFDTAVNLDNFEVCFFPHGAEVCPVSGAELTLS